MSDHNVLIVCFQVYKEFQHAYAEGSINCSERGNYATWFIPLSLKFVYKLFSHDKEYIRFELG
jgi:hypothetical protein